MDNSTFSSCAASFGVAQPERCFAGDAVPRSLFDLASLTKPLVTALLALKAADRGELDLDEEASAYLGPCPALALGPSVRHLLTHSSGLPPIPALEKAFPRAEDAERGRAVETLLGISPAARPGERIEYSCTGYLILGLILERIGGERLGDLFHREIAEPLCLGGRALFNPEPGRRAQAVPTEFCSWRGRRIQGEVHDESSWCLGGDGGNAGLFAELEAVERLFSVYLDGSGLFSEELALQARSCQAEGDGQKRGLGLLISAPAPGWSEQSYGHTGFVGNSMWRDPESGLTVILLSNRVYFGRDASLPKIQALREGFHRAAAQALA